MKEANRVADGEMEITPQMIEAGICEATDRSAGPVEDTVRAIYTAMEVERLLKPRFEFPMVLPAFTGRR